MNAAFCGPRNPPAPPTAPGADGHSRRLLDAIVEIHAHVGDGLTDQDLTCLLLASDLPTEAGSSFLSFSNHCATFKVPPQDPADWYPPGGWIAPEKKRLAGAVAAKYQLALDEPPDRDLDVFPRLDAPPVRHHFELTRLGESVIVAHPRYLRIRLFATLPGARCLGSTPRLPLHLGPALLQDLSSLYRGRGARATPPVLGWRQAWPDLEPFPVAGNLGESPGASDALREEWTHIHEQLREGTAGRAEDGKRARSRQVPHNHA